MLIFGITKANKTLFAQEACHVVGEQDIDTVQWGKCHQEGKHRSLWGPDWGGYSPHWGGAQTSRVGNPRTESWRCLELGKKGWQLRIERWAFWSKVRRHKRTQQDQVSERRGYDIEDLTPGKWSWKVICSQGSNLHHYLTNHPKEWLTTITIMHFSHKSAVYQSSLEKAHLSSTRDQLVGLTECRRSCSKNAGLPCTAASQCWWSTGSLASAEGQEPQLLSRWASPQAYPPHTAQCLCAQCEHLKTEPSGGCMAFDDLASKIT